MIKATVILIFLAIATLQANDQEITLNDFARFVSNHNNINIYIDEDLRDTKVHLIVPDSIKNSHLKKLFTKTVNKLGFNLQKLGKTYYLTKKLKYIDRDYIYKLKYNSSKDCKALLSSLELKYSYLENSNSFIIKSTSRDYPKVKKHLLAIDKQQSQVMLKIMIFEFNDNNIKERGVQWGTIYKDISNSTTTALNAIVATINSSNTPMASNDFYGAIRLLNEDKYINIKQFPYVLAKNNKMFKFEAVENIPYLISSTTTEATNISEQNTIEYKDVGLKINGRSFIYDDYITLDIDLIIEDLIIEDNGNSQAFIMPKTYKRVLKSNTNIQYNKVLLLSGIKRVKHIKDIYSVPLLGDIPFLGALFRYTNKKDEELSITIAIEVIKPTNQKLIEKQKEILPLDFFSRNEKKIEGAKLP